MIFGLAVRLTRLVGRTRNSLWLEDFNKLLWQALWACALLLALGAIGRWWLGISERLTITLVASLPVLIALLMTARRRPTLDRAVAVADRRAGADSLLLSAWDLLQRAGPHPAAGTVLLARADLCLCGWEARPAATEPGAHPRRFWLPLLATLAVLPLLGLEQRHASLDLADSDLAVSHTTDSGALETSLETLIEELRRNGPDGPPIGPEKRGSGPGPQGSDAAPGDLRPDGETRVPAPGAGTGPDYGAGDVAGTGAARTAAPSRTRAAPTAPEHLVDLPRRGAVSGVSSGSGASLRPTHEDPARSRGDKAPPAELPTRIQPHQTALDPGRRALADRFFALSRKQGSQ